jgi:hypothetical protein
MIIRQLLVATLVMLTTFKAAGQDQKSLLGNLTESERKSIEAIALYPEDIRLAVLEVASHPAQMITIKRLQEESQQNFRNLVERYPRETQEAIWDLTRFDGLMEAIAASDLTRPSLDAIVQSYPPEISETVRRLQSNDFALIREVVHLRLSTEQASRELFSSESAEFQHAINVLLDHPEVLSIMMDEVELAIMIGDIYLNERTWLLRKADSLHIALAAENSRSLEDWKATVENDPELQDELRASLQEYSGDYPFDDVYYSEGEDIPVTIRNEDQIVDHISVYYHYHYPFWFGYPYWYDYPRWRPFPYWYDWGFYPFYRRPLMVIGLPRYHVVWWYFNKPYHHYRYNHLSTQLIQHYHTHREFGGGITSAVNHWQMQNRNVITNDFLSNRPQLSENLRLYGQMEEKRLSYNQRKSPDKRLTSEEYLLKKERKYEPIKAETSRVQRPEVAREQILRDLDNKPERTRTTTPPKTTERKEQIRTIDKAKEYHRNNWTRKPAERAPSTSPAPSRTSPRQKTSTPAKRTPTRKTN